MLSGTALFCAQMAAAQDVTLVLDDPELRSVVRDASLTLQLRNDADASAADYVAAARVDYRRILTGLYSQGYYSGTVSILIDGREAGTLAPLDAPRQITQVQIIVDPGAAFVFGQTDLGPLPENAVPPETFAPGQPAKTGEISNAVDQGITAWRSQGHALAQRSDQRILAHHPDHRLDVAINIDPGPQLRFGPLTITGNTAVRTDRIDEIAGLPSGIFDPQEAERAASRLRRTGAFQSVALIEGDTIVNGDQLPYELQVVEMPQRRLGFGVEYSTVEGLTLSSFWLHRNLLGGAERLRANGEVTGIGGTTGGIDYELGLTYGRPATLNPDTDLYAELLAQRIDDPGYALDQFSAEVGLTKTIHDWLSYNVGVGYLTADVSDDLGDRTYQYLTFPVSAQADRRDNALNPSDGWYARVELTPFSRIDANDKGGRLYGDGRLYRTVGNDRAVLAFRSQIGSVFAVTADRAPADYLFFSGGGGTVRGQPYQSLGVADGEDLIGGRSFLGFQTEARIDVTDSIGVVGFYDTGFIGADAFDFTNGDWHSGAGLGVRYETGIGPIRLDVAAPVSGDNSGGVQFYIGIGQAF